MKKKIIIPVAILIFTGAIGSGIYYSQPSSTPVGGTFAMANTQRLTTQVTKGDITSSITASGSVETSDTYTYYSETTSPIDEVLVNVGDTVKAGDVILTYDTETTIKELNSSIKQLELDIQNATLELNSMTEPLSATEEFNYKDSIYSKEKSIISAQNSYEDKLEEYATKEDSVQEATADIETAKQTMEYQEKLYELGTVSLDVYNSYVTEYEK